MVLVQSSPQVQAARTQPNPIRIVAIAGAIAFNLALLMTLAMPGAPAIMPPALTTRIQVVDIPPKADPKPEPVDVAASAPRKIASESRPAPATLQPRVAAPGPAIEPVLLAPDSFAADQATSNDTVPADTATAPAGPIAGAKLAYAVAPPPPYPVAQLRNRVQGTVLLQVLVDIDGRPLDVTIHTSSGNRALDRTAQQHVLKHWTFAPATRDGQPVQALGLVPIDFRLE